LNEWKRVESLRWRASLIGVPGQREGISKPQLRVAGARLKCAPMFNSKGNGVLLMPLPLGNGRTLPRRNDKSAWKGKPLLCLSGGNVGHF
jgi:hypothetical protein